MRYIFFLVEEPSIKPVIDSIVTKIVDPNSEWYEVKIHQGKQDLRKALKSVVPTLSKVPNVRIMVLQDQDQYDCEELKNELLNEIEKHCECPFKIRIVCRELESWFLGDLEAVQEAFPRFRYNQYISGSKFRNPDLVQNPHLELLKIIPEYSGLKTLPKVQTSEKISPYLNVNRNRSVSFKHFYNAIKELFS